MKRLALDAEKSEILKRREFVCVDIPWEGPAPARDEEGDDDGLKCYKVGRMDIFESRTIESMNLYDPAPGPKKFEELENAAEIARLDETLQVKLGSEVFDEDGKLAGITADVRLLLKKGEWYARVEIAGKETYLDKLTEEETQGGEPMFALGRVFVGWMTPDDYMKYIWGQVEADSEYGKGIAREARQRLEAEIRAQGGEWGGAVTAHKITPKIGLNNEVYVLPHRRGRCAGRLINCLTGEHIRDIRLMDCGEHLRRQWAAVVEQARYEMGEFTEKENYAIEIQTELHTRSRHWEYALNVFNGVLGS